MRKYISTIFILAFILLGFSFITPSVQAFDSGCVAGSTYSITTGLPCYGSQVGYQQNSYIPGCFGTNAYSTTTGQYCFSSQVGGYQNNYIPGCIAGNAFSVTTGQSCYGPQVGYQNPVYIPGCTGAGSYSTITGQSCYGSSYGNPPNAFLNQQFYIGQRGADVFALQQMLFNAGLYFGRIDGVYGPMTDQAFIQYQSQQYVNPVPINPCSSYNSGYYPNNCPVTYGSQPTISGVSGPQTLAVNQAGTWTVNAYSNSSYTTYGNNLSYSVNWGDQGYQPLYSSSSSLYYQPQQSATFTHTYMQAGTYTAVFTVTNSAGQTAQTSLTVRVGGSIYGGYTPAISYLSPASGITGSQVTIYGTGFNSTYSCTTYPCPGYYPSSTNTINFGGNIIPSVYSSNGTTLTFIVPYVNSGIYPVYVTNTNGTSNSVNFTVTAGSQGFSPTISYISPTSGSIGSQATIYGSGFTLSGNTVNIGSASVYNLSSFSNSSITFTIPSNVGTIYCIQAPCAQNFNVSVTNANGTSNPVNFLITNGGVASSPSIYSLNPSGGSIGTVVTVNGTGFTSVNNIVHFSLNTSNGGFTSAYLPNISSNGASLTFTVPSHSSIACEYTAPYCYPQDFSLPSGTYNVWVENSLGISNQLQFIRY